MQESDANRRFGSLRRLYGVESSQRIYDSHVVVVGIGGVGSWVVEALARSGMSQLTLIDLDHVAESNINRQVHASDHSLGQAKVHAMASRVASYHPACHVNTVEEFVTPENWPLLQAFCQSADVLVDACDQLKAKAAMAAWALAKGMPFVTVGAAGGKIQAHKVEVADLLDVTHDPLLAKLRYQLRRSGHLAKNAKRAGICSVFSREPVAPPHASCDVGEGDGSLNCHGYGSSVAVTATFGMVAASWVMEQCAALKKNGVAEKEVKITL